MKKLIIILLLILIMTGCKKSSEDFLITIDTEISVCQESCVTDQAEIRVLLTNFYELMDAQILTIAENEGDIPSPMSVEVSYAKDEIPRSSPILQINQNSILKPYQDFFSYSSMFNAYIGVLVIGEDEQSWGSVSVTDVDYGFDDVSGFYKHTYNSGKENERIEGFKFKITEDDMQYEFIVYSTNLESYQYTSFQNNIYRKYTYTSESIYSFTYINMNSNSIVEYSVKDQDEIVNIYDPDSKDVYRMVNSNYETSHFEDLEFVASLRKDDTGYPVQFSLYFTDGWDEVVYRDPSVIPYSTIFNEEVRVFEDYDILVSSLKGRYYNTNALMTLSETQLEDYEFPVEFEGNTSISELKEKLDDFMDMENPLDIVGLEITSIQNRCIEILDMITEKYS